MMSCCFDEHHAITVIAATSALAPTSPLSGSKAVLAGCAMSIYMSSLVVLNTCGGGPVSS
jgi:hypothetical protein